MKLQRTVQINPALFGIVPAMNVLFLALIYFTMSSTFTLQHGVSVALPFSAFSLRPQRDPQIVSITATPVPTIYFRDQRMTLDELGESLAAGVNGDRTLILRADRRVPYDLVMAVTNAGLRSGFSVVLATAQESR